MNEEFMRVAIELANKGIGKVNPNPLVGSVIVKDGEIIGSGYHALYGGEHAEINAFKSLKTDCVGAELYVTLEPCSHYGKTSPCVDKIIERGISKVYIGAFDPNPLVAGKGIEKLRQAGIEVEIGVLNIQCIKQQEVFRKYIQTKKPFVLYKSAMSIDGKICTKYGESMWISCEKSRREVQKLRSSLMGIMVGVDTIIFDNPRLTCRLEEGRNPIRIIVDSKLRIPRESNVLTDELNKNTIIATTKFCDEEYKRELIERGIKIIVIKSKDGKVDLNDLMIKLGERGIDGILLEGGSKLAYSAISQGIVDKIQFYISPKIIGGNFKTPIGGNGIEKLSDAFKIYDLITRKVDTDIVIEGYLKEVR